MAAVATKTRRQELQVEQPPRTILRGGERIDISHLTGADLFEALKSDEEHWGYSRLSAETGRSVVRIRKWVVNVGAAARSGAAPDDKTFIEPDGYFEGSPWWEAGRARAALCQMGVMTRDGRMIPHKPTGRTAGAKDLGPRRWSHAPMRDTAAGVYQEYLKLTGRRRNPLSDREARNELASKHGITRTQLARRINTGRELVEAKKKGDAAQQPEVDKAALRARLAELVAEQRAAGYSERGASERARAALAEETGCTRRQIAGYTAAVEAAATDKTG